MYATTELEPFQVIGISTRTSNQNDQAKKDIGELFDKLIHQRLIEQIPDKESEEVYCVYTDYESDHNGPYTVILGCKTTSLNNIPNGFVGKTIPKTKYQIYKSIGKLPDCVAETWDEIWKATSSNRKYTADFDVYGSKSQHPTHAEVDTYLSIVN